MEITLFDEGFGVIGDPVKRWLSLSFSDAWNKNGSFTLKLRPDEFTNVRESTWLNFGDHTFENETQYSDDNDASVTLTGSSLNVLFDRIVIKEDERLQGNLEAEIRTFVSKYASGGSQKIDKFILGPAQGFGRAIDATAARGQTLNDFLYSALNLRGFSYVLHYDRSADEIVFVLLRGVDRTQDQSVYPPVLLSTQDAIEKASYKKSIKDSRNFAVVCDEDEDDPQTLEVDLSYGKPIKALYVSARSATGEDDLGDVLVAVGAAGYIATSPDGITWTTRTSGTANALYSVDYQNGKYIAGGANGTIVTSADGINWSVQSSGVADAIEGVVYDDGLYKAFCSTGKILYSYDAAAWATAFAGPQKTVNAVSTPKQYVAFSSGGDTAHKLVSFDGIKWTGTDIPLGLAAASSGLLRTCFSMGLIVCAGYWYNGSIYTPLVVTSADNGISAAVHSISTLAGYRFLDLAAGLGIFVAIGQPNIIAYSQDGVTWHNCTPSGYEIDYISIAFDGTKFYAYGHSTRYVAISEDGINWTVSADGLGTGIEAVVRGISAYTASLYAIGVAALQEAEVVETLDGEVNSELAPEYETDYNLGDLVDAVDPDRELLFTKRVLSVEHINDEKQDAVIPQLGKDFLSLRQFIAKEIKKYV